MPCRRSESISAFIFFFDVNFSSSKTFWVFLDIFIKIVYNNNNRNVVRKHEFSVRTDVNLIVVAVLWSDDIKERAKSVAWLSLQEGLHSETSTWRRRLPKENVNDLTLLYRWRHFICKRGEFHFYSISWAILDDKDTVFKFNTSANRKSKIEADYIIKNELQGIHYYFLVSKKILRISFFGSSCFTEIKMSKILQ